jgi:ribosomal protein S18 acetylase RimI-like enzyme
LAKHYNEGDKNMKNLQHIRINCGTDKDYIFECRAKINYACDTPWARVVACDKYRDRWLAWPGQADGFWRSLCQSMRDERTIAELIKTENGESVGYLWVAFRGEDPLFIHADMQDIYIEEAYRRTGVASYLMDYAEQHAKWYGAKVIRSGTGCENIISQAMHEKAGYYVYRYEYEKVLSE